MASIIVRHINAIHVRMILVRRQAPAWVRVQYIQAKIPAKRLVIGNMSVKPIVIQVKGSVKKVILVH
jgi:hypothetical protein